jgi:hypothetical protein
MLALEVVTLPVTDIDRALALLLSRSASILDVDYGPLPTSEFSSSHRPDRRVPYHWS